MENNRQEAIEKLRDLIEGIDLAMLTTIDGGVLLASDEHAASRI
jgi:hypothetical protein